MWSFVSVAAGRGTRLGGEPKQFRLLAGRPMWAWSALLAEALYRAGEVSDFALVLPAGQTELPHEFLPGGSMPFAIVEGGKERTDSVRNGVARANGEWVLVHDAARPFASISLCRRLMAAAREKCGAVPVLPLSDAVKRIEGDRVTTFPREGLFATQTPQAFLRERLLAALVGGDFRDEAEAWLASGAELATVEGERMNFKVTYEEDYEMARRLAGRETRVGHGFDVHPLVPERPLVLAGMIVQSPLGLVGHSDADLVAHAVADALLGAAGEPDLGTLYPASDERWRGADSMQILADVTSRVLSCGWQIRWVDVTIEAQIPRIGALVSEMARNLDVLLSKDAGRVANVKVKSAEHLGSLGRGEGMACHAVATLMR